MSPRPKDDALPTATRLRVLVALPLLVVLVVFLVYLDFRDWSLRSPRLGAASPATNQFVPRNRTKSPRLKTPGFSETTRTDRTHPSVYADGEVIGSSASPSPRSESAEPGVSTSSPPPPPLRVVSSAVPLVLFGEVPVMIGKVTLLGKPPAELPISFDPRCGRLDGMRTTTRHFVVNAEGGVADVVVSVKGAAAHIAALTPAEREASRSALLVLALSRKLPEIEMRRCEFEPYVSATIANGDVLLRNMDPVLHTAHANPTVEGNPAKGFTFLANSRFETFSFQKPEDFIRIKCNVHPWMFAYVSVFDHPFFDVTDTNGVFRVPLPPPGTFVVEAVHRKAGRKEQVVEIKRGESPVVNFVFDLR